MSYKTKQKQSYMRALIIFGLFIFASVLVGLYQFYTTSFGASAKLPTLLSIKETTRTNLANDKVALPSTLNLSVPYVPQAPFNNWSVHEESCEEAALLMYHEYLSKTNYPNNRVPDAAADSTLRAMKSWQVTNYGAERDLSMEILGKFAKDYYGFSSHVSTNITDADIKTAIFDGSPVLVPVMTHSLLNNMYGPYTVYHVLMIKGYDATGVITNDAGVGNGPDHHYDWSVLWSAIDAQTSKMGQGRVMLTVSK